jgi:hypothetical protein
LLEVRPLLFALALGHLEGEVLCLGTRIVAPDTAGSGIKVHGASFQGKPGDRADGTIGKEPPGATVVEASADAPHGISGKGLRGSGFP